MRVPRFYQDSEFHVGQSIALSKENHRHAAQVLRLKKNASLILFNGLGGEYSAKVKATDKRNTEISIESYDRVDRESTLKIALAIANIKQDKMDFAIQKAVELGVESIQPLDTHRSVVKLKSKRLEKKIQHWQGVVIAACEQSGRTKIPTIQTPVSLEHFLKEQVKNDSLSLVMLPESTTKLIDLKPNQPLDSLNLLIGPEGGFTPEEERAMKGYSVQAINFGKRILRAETAAIAGLTALQQQWGDL